MTKFNELYESIIKKDAVKMLSDVGEMIKSEMSHPESMDETSILDKINVYEEMLDGIKKSLKVR